MRRIKSAPSLYILIEDETALYPLKNKKIYEIALDQAKKSQFKPDVKILCPRNIYESNIHAFNTEPNLIIYDKFEDYLLDLKFESEILIFHNASRPLVPKRIYDQGIKMLMQGRDAVKQQHVVVDTLKRVDKDSFILETVDRDLAKAVTSPEFYWTESIIGLSRDFSWFYEIKDAANKDYIFGELESTRVRSKRDLFLVSALIEQGRLS